MELWHGSSQIVRAPRFALSRPHNDYGPGFYCTPYVELAKEWACPREVDGIANHYELDTEGLRVLDLEDGTHSVLEWLAILVNNRVVNAGVPIAQAAIEYLTENFLIDLAPYDIVRGYRADDSYFSFVRSFVSNGLTVEQLETVMHLGSLGTQVVLKSPRAFERIRFVDYETVPWEEFHRRRLNRDMAARKAFFEESRRGVTQGLYMNTILSEGLKQDDVRV